jgi:hypothetical protein
MKGVTMTQPSAPKTPAFDGMTVHEVSVLDTDEVSIVPAGEQLLAAMRLRRENPSSGCVLVH